MNFAAVRPDLIALVVALAFFAATTAFESAIRVERWSVPALFGYRLVLLIVTVAFFFAPARILIIASRPLGFSIWVGVAAAVVWCFAALPALQLVQNATRLCLGRPAKPIAWLPEAARLRPAPGGSRES